MPEGFSLRPVVPPCPCTGPEWPRLSRAIPPGPPAGARRRGRAPDGRRLARSAGLFRRACGPFPSGFACPKHCRLAPGRATPRGDAETKNKSGATIMRHVTKRRFLAAAAGGALGGLAVPIGADGQEMPPHGRELYEAAERAGGETRRRGA